MWLEPDKPKHKTLGKTEWDAVKSVNGNKCKLCGKSEKAVGVLEKAHLKARTRGGSQYIPLCPTCHYKYDHPKLLTATQKIKLGLDDKILNKLKPKKPAPKRRGPFDL